MDTLIDPIFLSRLQFALTIGFHILFPTLTIGLGLYLVAVEALWLCSKQELYYRMYRFWARIFAINFGVGVVTGVVMEFEFGTNWSRFVMASANVFSPLLYFEVLTAFFLEAGFLGIMLFGWKRVRPVVHFAATCMVAAGAIISAGWILAANSWMQTPAGFRLVDGKFMVTDFAAAIFSPSFPIRLCHMLMACFETSVFAVAGISAYFLLKGAYLPFYRRSMGLALLMAAAFAPLQVFLGDTNGREVFFHQPAKLAAIEGHWETNRDGGAPLSLVGIPDMEQERTLYEISIPECLSLLVTHTSKGRVPGLKEFPRPDRPNSLVVYWAFRLMAGIGFIFLFVTCWAGLLWWHKRSFQSRLFLTTVVAVQPLGWLAVEMGWVTAEMGRQPWLIYSLVRTSHGTSPIPAGNVIWSLALFAVIFLAIGGSYLYYVFKVLRGGPDLVSAIPPIQRPAGMKVLEKLPGQTGEE